MSVRCALQWQERRCHRSHLHDYGEIQCKIETSLVAQLNNQILHDTGFSNIRDLPGLLHPALAVTNKFATLSPSSTIGIQGWSMFKDGMLTWLSVRSNPPKLVPQLLTPLSRKTNQPLATSCRVAPALPSHGKPPRHCPGQFADLACSDTDEYELFPMMRTSASSPQGHSTSESSPLPCLRVQRDNIWHDAGAFDIHVPVTFIFPRVVVEFLSPHWVVTDPIHFSSFLVISRTCSPLGVQAPATSPPGLFQPMSLHKWCLRRNGCLESRL